MAFLFISADIIIFNKKVVSFLASADKRMEVHYVGVDIMFLCLCVHT